MKESRTDSSALDHRSCARCGAMIRQRPLAAQPVLLTFFFALNFLAMLVVTQFKKVPPLYMWIWTGVEFIVGLGVMRGRILAKKMVFHCARCDSPLP